MKLNSLAKNGMGILDGLLIRFVEKELITIMYNT
jgi:hypothetical protein